LSPIKSILPALIVAVGATLIYYFFKYLPVPVQQALPLLPYLLFAAVLLMALYFNLSHLFYFSLVCFVSWLLINQGFQFDDLTVNIYFIGTLFVVLFVGLVAEKGLLTFASMLTHIMVIMIVSMTYGVWLRQPLNLAKWLQPEFLPIAWFDWTPLSQAVLLLLFLFLIILISVFVLRKKRQPFNAVVSLLVVLLLFQWLDNTLALNLTCDAGLLILLFATLQKSWHLAYVDELTALPGRRALEEKLKRSLGIYALAMVDIDHFKKFNDSYGHAVGDDVLAMIAAKIAQVGGGGKAFRYGGEEFTVIFNNHSADEVQSHLQSLIEAVAQTPFVVNRRKKQKPKTVQVTISIGLTDSINKANATQTIKVADEALYQAKKKGRNRLQLKG